MRIPGIDVVKRARVAELTLKHSNLPERYIRRMLEEVTYKPPNLPNYRQVTLRRIKSHFEMYRPWTLKFELENLKKKRKVFVEPIKDWSVFRGDRVEILKGRDKGKQGFVCEIIQERNWIFVKGLNTQMKRLGKTKTFPGLLVKVETPLLFPFDVSLVDPGDLKPVKVQWRYTEEGEKVRVSERTGRIIPMPIMEEETYDYKTKDSYKERDKDTPADEVTRITFEPSLQTFAMSIMEEYGIKEDRVPGKVYWY